MSVFKSWVMHGYTCSFDLNPVELKYFLFMVSLDKCCGSCNSGND